jgi:uncharacterized protein (TIGR02466 family)|tara:strand:+ start:265 stop:852 length:588 start_codon:yes stop_codon:yes gene_type:complete
MKTLTLFPTVISTSINPNHNQIEKQLKDECIRLRDITTKGGDNWHCDVYNTCNTYNLMENEKFKPLNDWVMSEVQQYAGMLGYQNKPFKSNVNGWFNIYEQYTYQETHDHIGGADISVIYYLTAPEGTGNTIFYSPEPGGVKSVFDNNNPYTYSHYYMKPEAGTLIMFKSNVKHGVQQNKTNKQKISLAYNFEIL